MDQGIIHCLKVGYKTDLLRRLLGVYDDDAVAKAALEAGSKQRRGCKGVAHGHKPHVLDAMTIIKAIWDGEKYARPESILHSWIKADCLPEKAQQQLKELDTRGASQPAEPALLSDLCSAMQNLCTVVARSSQAGPGVEDIQDMGAITTSQSMEAVETWVDVEDDPLVRDVEIDELLEGLDTPGVQDGSDAPEPEDTIDDEPSVDDPTPAVSEAEVDASILTLMNFCSARGNPEMMLAARKLDHMLRSDRAARKLLLQPSIQVFFPSTQS